MGGWVVIFSGGVQFFSFRATVFRSLLPDLLSCFLSHPWGLLPEGHEAQHRVHAIDHAELSLVEVARLLSGRWNELPTRTGKTHGAS